MTKTFLMLATIGLLIIGCSEQSEPANRTNNTTSTTMANSTVVITPTEQDLLSKGKSRATTCTACHGVNGISNVAIYPSLAGRDSTELKQLLLAYRSGKKVNPMMSPQAKALSEADVDLLAHYFAILPAK